MINQRDLEEGKEMWDERIYQHLTLTLNTGHIHIQYLMLSLAHQQLSAGFNKKKR